MHIEIKDLKTGKVHRIEEKGATFGRDKARSTITVDDSGVSGAHAKVFLRDGQWYIEDLKSSNGTWVDDHRVTSSAALNEGSRIKLFNYKMEVASVEAVASDGATAVFNAETAIADPHKKPEPAPVAAPADEEEEEEDLAPPENAKTERPKSKTSGGLLIGDPPAPKSSPSTKATTAITADKGRSDEVLVSKGDSEAFGANVKEAIAYYLVAIPKLLFNFKGTVKESIDNQKFPAMKPPQLIAWAVPPLVVGQIVAQITALALMIVVGHFAVVGWIIGVAIGVAIAIVSAIISGFIFHPVMKWLINILKGSSTDVTRSNYFVMVMTAAGLTTVVSGAGGLFGLIPLPFVTIVPVLLGLATTLITLYIAYNWMLFFGVVKWLLTVIKVLGIVVIALTAWNIFNVVRAGFSTIGNAFHSSGSTEVVIPAGLTAEQAAAMKAAQEQANKAMAGMSAEQQAVVKSAQEQAAKAMAAANAGTNGVAVPVPSAMQVPPPAGSTPPPTAVAPAPAQAGAAPTPAPPGAKPAALPAPAPAPTPAAAPANELPHAARSSDDYATYLQKREAVEQAIEKNPALLARTEGVLPLYRALHAEMSKVTAKYAKQKGGKDVVSERLRDAEMYDKTVDHVDALYRKVVGQ